MPIKLIVTDLDRTLLRTDKSISEYTVTVLNRCRENGIKVAFATGRPVRTAARYLAQVLCDGVVYHNGASAYVGSEQVYSAQMSSEDARTVIGVIQNLMPDATISCEIDDAHYANFDVSTLWSDTTAWLTDFTDLPERPADKVLVCVESPDVAQAIAASLPGYLYALLVDGNLCMILNRNASKLNAVARLAECFGIRLDEVVAFGDDYNDIDMLRGCGTGVAVANALEDVKAAADALCGSNDEDGVAKWIEENLLNIHLVEHLAVSES